MNLFIKQISPGLSTSCTPGVTILLSALIKTSLKWIKGRGRPIVTKEKELVTTLLMFQLSYWQEKTRQ